MNVGLLVRKRDLMRVHEIGDEVATLLGLEGSPDPHMLGTSELLDALVTQPLSEQWLAEDHRTGEALAFVHGNNLPFPAFPHHSALTLLERICIFYPSQRSGLSALAGSRSLSPSAE